MSEAVSALKNRIFEEMKIAMKAHDKSRLSVIRLIMAAIKQKEVDERIIVTDDHILVILEKMVKQRRESTNQYELAKRPDLVEQEKSEITVIQTYLPQPLSDQELNQIIRQAITESGAKTIPDMGKVMAILKPQLNGRAEMGIVSQKIKQQLS